MSMFRLLNKQKQKLPFNLPDNYFKNFEHRLTDVLKKRCDFKIDGYTGIGEINENNGNGSVLSLLKKNTLPYSVASGYFDTFYVELRKEISKNENFFSSTSNRRQERLITIFWQYANHISVAASVLLVLSFTVYYLVFLAQQNKNSEYSQEFTEYANIKPMDKNEVLKSLSEICYKDLSAHYNMYENIPDSDDYTDNIYTSSQNDVNAENIILNNISAVMVNNKK